MEPVISRAGVQDLHDIVQMCHSLWPDLPIEEHQREMENIVRSGMCGTLPAAIFVAKDREGIAQGFIQVGLRSHADGCDVSRPVGFVEGWFVKEPARMQGIGTALIRMAERWSIGQGCTEIASDTRTEDERSYRVHLALGFEVVDRCIHFRKALSPHF